MMKQLLANLRLIEEALAGFDDLRGESLLNLEERVRRLEGEVENLRRPLQADAVAAGRPHAP